MSKVSLLVICILSVTAMGVLSCKKQVDTELKGSWMKEAFINSNDADSAIWTFQNDGVLYIKNLTDTTWSDTGKYVVVEKNLKNYVRIEKLRNYTDHNRLNGDWKVIQYKKDKLTITKADENLNTGDESGNILREFTKIQ